MSVKGKATVLNEAGIHCRPSSVILKTVQGYPGEMRVSHPENGESDLTSMLDLMMMGLTQGTQVDVEVSGPQEEEQLQRVIELLERIYDFPDAGSS